LRDGAEPVCHGMVDEEYRGRVGRAHTGDEGEAPHRAVVRQGDRGELGDEPVDGFLASRPPVRKAHVVLGNMPHPVEVGLVDPAGAAPSGRLHQSLPEAWHLVQCTLDDSLELVPAWRRM
jgi:hypothetical protein